MAVGSYNSPVCSGSMHRRLYGRVVLRCLSAIEHSVVAHHLKYTEVLGRRIGKKLPPKSDAGVRRRYVNKMGKNAGSIDALEYVAFPGRFYRQFSISGLRGDDKSRWPSLGVVIRTQALRTPRRFFGPLLVDDLGDSNAIAGKDLLAARFLNRMVL